MNYSNMWISALGMLPTYIFGGLLMSTLPVLLWICSMLLLLFGSTFIYSVTVGKAVALQRKPGLVFVGLFFAQIALYLLIAILLS